MAQNNTTTIGLPASSSDLVFACFSCLTDSGKNTFWELFWEGEIEEDSDGYTKNRFSKGFSELDQTLL